MKPSQIKQAYEARNDGNRHFFDRNTMKFFGDRMSSYGARTIDGVTYMYRKPDSMVNVFGKWQRAGRQFFNAWRFNPETSDLDNCDPAETERIFTHIYR